MFGERLDSKVCSFVYGCCVFAGVVRDCCSCSQIRGAGWYNTFNPYADNWRILSLYTGAGAPENQLYTEMENYPYIPTVIPIYNEYHDITVC